MLHTLYADVNTLRWQICRRTIVKCAILRQPKLNYQIQQDCVTTCFLLLCSLYITKNPISREQYILIMKDMYDIRPRTPRRQNVYEVCIYKLYANLEYKPTNLLKISLVDRIQRNLSTYNMPVFHIIEWKITQK